MRTKRHSKQKRLQSYPCPFLIMVAICTIAVPTSVSAEKLRVRGSAPCELTARFAYQSCKAETTEEYLTTIANCTQSEDREVSQECKGEGRSGRREAREGCRDVRIARIDLCKELDERIYNPEYEADDFLSPAQTAADPNKYFPLIPGTVWVYKNVEEGETITVTVTDRTRIIDGIKTIVVNDVVILDENGETIEDTDDYYAQHKNGNVWYFGEVAQEYTAGFLDSLDGSFIAGENFAKPGILVKANPQVGDILRQEYALREAEDWSKVLSITGTANATGGTCNGTCMITEDGTPLDPDAIENKYYAPGIGVLLEVSEESGAVTELISMSTP